MTKTADLTFTPLKHSLNAIGSTRSLGPAAELNLIKNDQNTAGIPADVEFVELLVRYDYDGPGLAPGPTPHWFSVNFFYGVGAPDDFPGGSDGIHYQQTMDLSPGAGNFHHDVTLGVFRVPVVDGQFSVLFNETSASDDAQPQGTLSWQYLGYWRA